MASHLQTIYDKEWVPSKFGLINPNTLCYFNSLLQSLMSCSAPTQYIIEWPEHDRTSKKDVKPDNPLWDTFHTFLLDAMGDTPPKSAKPVIEMLRAKLVELKKPRFGIGQEDAGEGFHLLLDCMGDDAYAQHFMHRYVHDMYCPECKDIVSSKNDTSFHVEIPPNYAQNVVEWEDDSEVNYSGVLNQYIRHHITVLDDYKCPKCKNEKNIIRLSHMVLVPNVLVIQYNKFAGKFTSPCPLTLTFPSKSNKNPLNYKLVAKIEHFGSMGGGHYVAHCLRNDKPLLFNDSSVSEGTFTTSPATYICFYHIV